MDYLLNTAGNFGWIPPEERTEQMHAGHHGAVGMMPRFFIAGKTNEDAEKVDLTELWKHQTVTQELGYAYPGTRQEKGSCVGVGGGNVIFTLSVVEVVRLGDPEQILVPFWMLPYARSRFYAGMRSPGDGSMGSTFARAAREDGVVPANRSGLPPFENNNGLCWGGAAEIAWSDGDSQRILDLLTDGRKHLIGTTADISTTDDLEQAIRNLYPCTNASSLIPNPRVEADGEAYGRVARGGGHQTAFLGVWNHPSKGGRWFKYQNQWGLNWGKAGACWIPDADAQAIINNGRETYAFSQFSGFPAQSIDWTNL